MQNNSYHLIFQLLEKINEVFSEDLTVYIRPHRGMFDQNRKTLWIEPDTKHIPVEEVLDKMKIVKEWMRDRDFEDIVVDCM